MIYSPADDFSGKTLAAIPGMLGKLQYVAGLRQDSGVYVHWGMSRSHGEAAANQAIAGAHSQLFIEILRTPLSRLVEDLRSMASEHAMDARQLIQELVAQRELLVPQRLNGGSLRHFNSVLRSLSVLADAPALQSDPAALQIRRLGR
jgi:hypothetical protein